MRSGGAGGKADALHINWSPPVGNTPEASQILSRSRRVAIIAAPMAIIAATPEKSVLEVREEARM
jgi:hypothetical protein